MDFDFDSIVKWFREFHLDQVPPQWWWLIAGVLLFLLIVFCDEFRHFVGLTIATTLWIGSGLPVVWWIRSEWFIAPRDYSEIEKIARGVGWVYVPLWVLIFGSFLIDWRETVKMRKRIERALEYDPAPAHGDVDFADDDDLRNGGVL